MGIQLRQLRDGKGRDMGGSFSVRLQKMGGAGTLRGKGKGLF